jgi:rRNA-processing protein FCF1
MNKYFPHKLIRQFMTIAGMSHAYLDMLTDDIHESLAAGDQTGDLYRVGLNLVLSVMPLRDPVTTIRTLLERFDPWWTLDLPVARAIAHAIDEVSAEDTQALQSLGSDLELVRTWLSEDVRPMKSTLQLDFTALLDTARDWQSQDKKKLLETPADWTSVLNSEILVYHAVKPITSTASLVEVGGSVEKRLISLETVNNLVDGTLRMFAVSKVLRPGELTGIVSIEKVQENWHASKTYTPEGMPVPQSLIRLAYQLAARYEAAEQRHAQQKRVNHAMQLMTLTDMVIAIRGGADTRATHSHKTEMRPAKRYLYIDTSALLVQHERSVITEIINSAGSDSTALIVGDTVEELDRLKLSRPEMKQSVNAALRWVEFMLNNNRLKIETAYDTPVRPFADAALQRAVANHFDVASKQHGAVTVITQDIALRLRLRAQFAGQLLTTIDSRVLSPQGIRFHEARHGYVDVNSWNEATGEVNDKVYPSDINKICMDQH